MAIHLLNKDFGNIFYGLLDNTQDSVVIVSPFISFATATRFASWLEQTDGSVSCTIITRFNREEFIRGANSVEGLEVLLKAGARLYALQHLHTKLYIFDKSSVIMGSANFTFKGFFKNHELGLFVESEPLFSSKCVNYFENLLSEIEQNGNWEITQELIDKEKQLISKATVGRGRSQNEYNSHRWGAVIDEEENTEQSIPGCKIDNHFDILEEVLKEQSQDMNNVNTGIWIKFEGNSESRIPNNAIYLERKRKLHEYVHRTFYPRQPRSVRRGDIIFIAVVSKNELGLDTPMVVGYATAEGYNENNIISDKDKNSQRWNGRYPYYIEYTNGKFLKGPVKEGISLIELCNTLKHRVYPKTLNNPEVGVTEVLKRHHQKAHIQITSYARDYLVEKLEIIFKKQGYDSVM